MKTVSMSVLTIIASLAAVSSLGDENWQSLDDDGLHDPSNPAIRILQEPAEALSVLPPDGAGNKVNWVKAIEGGRIRPRASLQGDREVEILELEVVMTDTLPLPNVSFPHRQHTEWMSCDTCHEELFISRVGANPINMGRILQGEYCGLCHGAVSFPLTECNRCHSIRPEAGLPAPPSGAQIRPDP
jgi:c(7)-type cytochrome triheme protein